MQESKLYETVRKFVKEKYDCRVCDCIEAGKQGIGSVDVFGVRHTNLDNSEIEIIGVEVKTDKIPISANFGQAKGYSVFCDRMYFASLGEFSEEDVKIAKFLGIGLIKIIGQNTGFICNEVLEAPPNKPLVELRNYVLRYKGIFQCVSCKTFLKSKFTGVTTEPTKWTKSEVKNGKGLLLKNKGKEQFYCNTCAKKKLIL